MVILAKAVGLLKGPKALEKRLKAAEGPPAMRQNILVAMILVNHPSTAQRELSPLLLESIGKGTNCFMKLENAFSFMILISKVSNLSILILTFRYRSKLSKLDQ